MDNAIDAYRKAIELTPKPSAEQEINLAGALEPRFAQSGEIDDLNEAIDLYRQAVARVSIFSALLAPALSSLGQALKTRYDYSAVIDDLDEAIEYHRQAIQVTSARRAGTGRGFLSPGARAVALDYDASAQLSDLEEAIFVLQQAVIAAPGESPNLPVYAEALAASLRELYRRAGWF